MQIVMTGLAFGEQPRWHEGRLWFSDWGPQEVIAVDLEGNSEVILRGPSFPLCVDWLPDGRLLIVSSRDGLLLRREPDGSVVTHADLSGVSDRSWNEMVVDGRGNIYVNGAGFDLMAGEKFAPGLVALVTHDGSVRQVADGIAFPNGMVVTPDNSTLIVAESYRKRLRPSISQRTATCRKAGCGPTSAAASPTGSASTPRLPSGTGTSRTSVASAFGRAVRCCRQFSLIAAVSRARSGARIERRCS